MPRPNARAGQCVQQNNRRKPPRLFTNAQLVLAILITGISYSQGLTLFRNLGLTFISIGTFYRIQARLHQPIVDYEKKTVHRNREAMRPDATVGIDGSWNHRRHGTDCIVDMYDCRTGRIVDFEIVSNANRLQRGN
jgi:hypothetical protein